MYPLYNYYMLIKNEIANFKGLSCPWIYDIRSTRLLR
jgi:hypothetical protein